MNGLNEFSLNQYLQRRLNITDSPAPASTLAPEVMPVIVALPQDASDDYLRGTRRCQISYSQAASAAGEYAIMALRNPSGSGVIIRVEEILINLAASTGSIDAYVEVANLPSVGAINATVIDSRWPRGIGARTAGLVTMGLTATAPNFAWVKGYSYRYLSSDPSRIVASSIVLAPGSFVVFYTSGTNQALNMGFQWIERPAQPSELV